MCYIFSLPAAAPAQHERVHLAVAVPQEELDIDDGDGWSGM